MHSAKRFSWCLLAVCIIAGEGRASATAFTLNSYTVTARSADPGLVVSTTPLSPQPFGFALTNIGDTLTTGLFVLGSREVWTNPDDWIRYPITVAFDLAVPPQSFGGSVSGDAGAAWFLLSFGYAKWDGPALLPFGNSGLLSVSLEDVAFLLPGSALVDVTFTLVQQDTPAIPEPSSLLLVGTGLLGVVARVRRRM